jgi:hypothetical protein
MCGQPHPPSAIDILPTQLIGLRTFSFSPPRQRVSLDVSVLLLLFMSGKRDSVSELQPPKGLFFIPQVIHEYEEPRWNDIERRQPKSSETNLSHSHFVYHKSHTDWRGREPKPSRWQAGDYPPESCMARVTFCAALTSENLSVGFAIRIYCAAVARGPTTTVNISGMMVVGTSKC